MKEIKLNKGFTTQVDNEDYEYLNQFKWYARKDKTTFYVERNKTKKDPNRELKMSRLIMKPFKSLEIDHIDRNGMNNQKNNLRVCNRTQNMRNRKSWSSSGYLGVHINKEKYILAHIRIDGKCIHLGTFKTKIEAAKAYDIAAIKYFGEFANLNFK